MGGGGEDSCGRNRTQLVVTCIGVGHTEGGGWGGRQLREKQNSACGDAKRVLVNACENTTCDEVYWYWSMLPGDKTSL